MTFREFIEKEEAELFDVGIHQMDEFVGSALRFLGGVGGNFISQVGRGAVNTVSGLAQGAVGTGQTALAGLQAAGGGFEKGKETLGRGLSNLKSGSGRAVRGATQLGGALSGVSPVLRGAQAASEPMGISGVYAPNSKNRTFSQDLLGLDSWEKPKPTKAIEKKQPKPPSKDVETKTFLRDLETKEKAKVKPQPEAWKNLVIAYKQARTSQEREEIRRKMRLVNPYLYQQAVEAGKRKKQV